MRGSTDHVRPIVSQNTLKKEHLFLVFVADGYPECNIFGQGWQ